MTVAMYISVLAFTVLASTAAEGPCEERAFEGADFVVCRFSAEDDIRLFLNDAGGNRYGHFNFLNEALGESGEALHFAMNAGMYHKDRSPVGFYREKGVDIAPINNNDGPGNFHLKPNGVFFVTENGDAFVESTDLYLRVKRAPPPYATQSGPMLVIDGALHPRFLPDSESKKRRNGVGVDDEGDVFFVLTDTPVRFYDFARFFRDELKTPNALYLDGVISRIYAPNLGRNDPGLAMGPIVGIVTKND